LLVDNPIDRYSIGDRTEGLKYNPDGSLTIYVQKNCPDKERESNWLPAPAGPMSIISRMYRGHHSGPFLQVSRSGAARYLGAECDSQGDVGFWPEAELWLKRGLRLLTG
jgi:hypothetical protein